MWQAAAPPGRRAPRGTRTWLKLMPWESARRGAVPKGSLHTLLPSHASWLVRTLTEGHGVMVKRRFLTVVAVPAAAAALLGALPGAADAVTAAAPGAAAAAAGPGFPPLTPALAARLARGADDPVIVILKSQPRPAEAASPAARAASAAVTTAQASLAAELRQVHATGMKRFTLVNAIAATVSTAEAHRLAADPAVAQVIPDVTFTVADPATGVTHPLPPASAPSPARPPSLPLHDDPRRLRGRREEPARAGRPGADRHRVRQRVGAHRAVARLYRCRGEGRVHRRRPRPGQRELQAEVRCVGVHRRQRLHRERPRRAGRRRRGVPRREHHRRPGPQDLQRQRLRAPRATRGAATSRSRASRRAPRSSASTSSPTTPVTCSSPPLRRSPRRSTTRSRRTRSTC